MDIALMMRALALLLVTRDVSPEERADMISILLKRANEIDGANYRSRREETRLGS